LSEIERETSGERGRYVYRADGVEAELTYRVLSPGRIVADHTGVPDAFRGQGIALKLVERLVADARAEGVTVVPACSYVAAQAKRHKEWADVFPAA
jgi:predicted GNAT family acetyltransferase